MKKEKRSKSKRRVFTIREQNVHLLQMIVLSAVLIFHILLIIYSLALMSIRYTHICETEIYIVIDMSSKMKIVQVVQPTLKIHRKLRN